MKILWVTKKYFDRDVDTATWVEVTKEWLKSDNDVTLIGTYQRKRTNFGLGRHFIQIPERFSGNKILAYPYKIIRILSYVFSAFTKQKWDAVILHYDFVLYLFPLKLLSKIKIFKTKFICDVRTFPNETNTLRERILDWQFGIVMRYSNILLDGITVITPAMKEQIIKKYNLNGKNIGVWTSGVNPCLFSPEKIKKLSDYKKRFENKFVVFFHGALSEMRGIDKAIHAVKLLKPKYGGAIILFILSFGTLKETYEKLVRELSLQDNVLIENVVPYEMVPSFINMIDVGIMPYYDIDYWNTSSPIKLLEYLAMEKPVIVSDIRSHRDVIGNSQCGIYIPDNEPITISKAIEEAYKLRDKLPIYGKYGRGMILERYTWGKRAEDFLTYIKSVTENE